MIWQALLLTNPDDVSETVALAHQVNNDLILPRGFALRLLHGLAPHGIEVQWVDERVEAAAKKQLHMQLPPGLALRHYQERAVQRMIAAEQGIYISQTGSGKSWTAAAVMTSLQQRSIVLVDKVHIASQWIKRLAEVGIEASYVGDGVWQDNCDVVIALRQSLWSHRERLDEANWWDGFGVVFVDESHGITSTTLRQVLARFKARYRFGMSATPDRWEWLIMVARSLFGEVLCRTTDDELEEAGVLVRPRVLAIKTDLEYKWNRKAQSTKEWHRLANAIVTDAGRNQIIGRVLRAALGRCVMVQTDRLAHADEIVAQAYAAGWAHGDVLMLVGKVGREERMRIYDRASQGNCVVVTTIGKEALDIPRLDTYVIAWPSKSDTNVIQMVGRIKRVHEQKKSPIVVDLYDRVGPCIQHFSSRRGTYERERLSIQIIDSNVDFTAAFSY